MDNEGCFTGGNTHPHVIGKVVRLCLMVKTQVIFIPIRHPKSNAFIKLMIDMFGYVIIWMIRSWSINMPLTFLMSTVANIVIVR